MRTSRAKAASYAGQMSDSAPYPSPETSTVARQAPAPVSDALSSILEMVAESETLLADVERALERLDAGSYDLCEVCGAEIEPTRLEASPATRRCQAHSL